MVQGRPCEYGADVGRCSNFKFFSCMNTHIAATNITPHRTRFLIPWTTMSCAQNSSLGLLFLYTSCVLFLSIYLTLVVSCIQSCAHVCLCTRAKCCYIFSSLLLLAVRINSSQIAHSYTQKKSRRECLLMQKFLYRRSKAVTSFMTALFNHDKCFYLFILFILEK